MTKALAAGILMCALAAPALFAANVSFLVMETGLPKESASSQYSALWESSLMDVFFESGHIVSNAPRIRLARAPDPGEFPPEAETDYADAIVGGMDYFLIAIVDYSSRDVSLRLFRTRSGDLVAERSHEGCLAASAREETESVRSAAREMAALLR